MWRPVSSVTHVLSRACLFVSVREALGWVGLVTKVPVPVFGARILKWLGGEERSARIQSRQIQSNWPASKFRPGRWAVVRAICAVVGVREVTRAVAVVALWKIWWRGEETN